MFINKIIAATAAVALLGSAGFAAAQPIYADDMTSIHVPTAGIDVNTQAGAHRLLARVRAAASTICGDKPDSRELQRSAMFGVCLTRTVDRAVVTSGMPLLRVANGGGTVILQASR